HSDKRNGMTVIDHFFEAFRRTQRNIPTDISMSKREWRTRTAIDGIGAGNSNRHGRAAMEHSGTARTPPTHTNDANHAEHKPHAQHAFLSLTGDFQRPLTLTLDQLRAHASVRADPFDLRCFTTNRFIRKVDSYCGVLLKDLIEVAGLRNDRPGDF